MSTLSTAHAELAAVRDLTVAYGRGETRVEALRAVTLTIAPSESLALCGRSGSGKTTLLHALGGLVEPTAGGVWWLGEALSSLDAAARGRARAAGIAYVFQGANLLPHFTAYENVAFAAHYAGADDVEPAELLALVGLEAKLDFLPSELSGGEAQRVAIARAIAQRAELLLCDEPTGHLDSDTGARVLDLIERLQEAYRFALVLATHDPDVAARCARTVELLDGRIVGTVRTA
ncbi:MAG TPA: ATP-binding cassette domain-containing protein [Conexibacter sp.]|jgi:putative ABC transport system ATP-binding protein|nr:ATP-binding cassette domain-containing protein [Conexibacter sp.]